MTAVVGERAALPDHGTYRSYVGLPEKKIRGCPCPECREAGRRYRKRRDVLNATGRTLMVDPGQAAAHLRHLFRCGAGWNQMVDASACSSSTIHRLLGGFTKPIRRTTQDKILMVGVADALCPGRRIPAVGSIRRVRAMVAMGHRVMDIVSACEVNQTTVANLLRGEKKMVEASTHDRIVCAARRFATFQGPSSRSIVRARRKGWRTFAAWDDIDDPKCRPSVGPKPKQRDRRAALIQATAELSLLGSAPAEIADRMGVQWDSIVTAHRREGIPVPGVAAHALAG